jgi:hypothetical protein
MQPRLPKILPHRVEHVELDWAVQMKETTERLMEQ